MKVEITRRGVYDKKSKPIPVGKTITVEGDEMPAWLIGKAVEVGKRNAAVTNPAEGGGEQAQTGDDTVAAGA